MGHNHRLRAELDHQELAALQRFVMAVQEGPHLHKPKVEFDQVSRGPKGQIFVPVLLSGQTPNPDLAIRMGHEAEDLYKQSGCRFVLVQQLETDPERQSFVWGDGIWQNVP
jgi:hypothetical protein